MHIAPDRSKEFAFATGHLNHTQVQQNPCIGRFSDSVALGYGSDDRLVVTMGRRNFDLSACRFVGSSVHWHRFVCWRSSAFWLPECRSIAFVRRDVNSSEFRFVGLSIRRSLTYRVVGRRHIGNCNTVATSKTN